MIYFKAFTEDIINSRKVLFSKNITTWNLQNSTKEIIGAIVNHPVLIELFAEIIVKCEVQLDENATVFTLKAIVKMYIQVCSCSK